MKVLYSEFSSNFWLDVAEELAQRFDWQPCYWIAPPKYAALVRKRFPGTPFHSTMDAVRSIPAAEYAQLPGAVLDRTLLENLAVCESAVLKMMDRMDGLETFSYHERIRHYHRLVAYWHAVLDHLQPDIVCFVTIPHMVYDYVLYELCRLRGIPTLMFAATNMLGYAYLRQDYDQDGVLQQGYRQLLAAYRGEPIILAEEVERYLQSMQGDYNRVPLYVRFVSKTDLYRDETSPVRRLLDVRNYPRRIQKQIDILKRKIRPPMNYLKERGKPPEASNVGGLAYRFFRWRSRRRMADLARYYHRLAVERVDLERPYIFVGLNYQPEATTSPQGKAYVHLQLMVEMLSRLLPDGWLLYVKEHPAEFDPSWSFRTQSARTKIFYDDLAALPNVRLIPTKSITYDLIDRAIAVAAATGTVGWQAVLRGKPALVFGYPWYQGCEGVFNISTQQDCQAALNSIQAGYRVDLEKVRLFCSAVTKFGLRLPVEEKMRRWGGNTDDAPAVADAMAQFYQEIQSRERR